MALDPVIVSIKPPKTPFMDRLPKLPNFGPKQTKILTAIAAIVIVISMIIIALATTLANNNKFKKAHNITTAESIAKAAAEGTVKNSNALPGAGEVLGVGGTSGENSPVVSLKADHGSVSVGSTVRLTWSVTNNPKSCTASSDWSGDKPSSGSESSTPLTAVQSYEFTLTCKTDKGTGFSTVSIGALQVGTSAVAGGPTVNLAAQPSTVFVGQSAVLNWTSTGNASSCTASGSWSGNKAANGQASTGALTSTGTKSYTLICSNGSGSSNPAQATIDVISPPPGAMVINFDISPVGPVTPNTTATLSWNVTNATSCAASGDWNSSIGTSGSKSTGALSLAGVPAGTYLRTYAYTITCTGADGSTSFSSQSIDVVPAPPTISTFSFSPSTVSVNANSTLNWSSSSTDDPTYTCSGSGGWAGPQATGSNKTAIINRGTVGSYPFSLSCSNHGGSTTISASVNVVALPTANVSAGATAVSPNSSTTINWISSNAASCTGSNGLAGSNSTSGSKNSGPLTVATTYTVTCQNAAGSTVTSSTTVSINSGPATIAPVVATFAASPTTVGVGGSTNLTWTVNNNPTLCTATSTGSVWTGSQAASGTSVTVGPLNTAGSITFTLTCSNTAGTGTRSVSVAVEAVPVVSTFTLTPSTIAAGSSTTVAWSATNTPTTCNALGAWTGSKAAPSGSQPDGSALVAGTYTYQIYCSNAGGQGPTASVTLMVTAGTTYCKTANKGIAGTPCFGPNQLAVHNTATDCWGYNVGGGYNLVIIITSLAGSNLNSFHKGNADLSKASPVANLCGNVDLQPILNGTKSISPTSGKHNHTGGAATNDSTMRTYKAGYYDPLMP